MKLTNQEKKDILDCVLRKISHIADKDYQRRVWIKGEGPECDDFIETVCGFFNVVEIVLERSKEFGLNDNYFHILEKFSKFFGNFSDENDFPQLFIDTPEWNKITILAQEALEVFNYHKDVNRKQVLERVLDDLTGISNKKYKPMDWILAEGSKRDDFDAAVCHYFKTIDSVLEEYKEYGISEMQFHLLQKFHEEFKNFWTKYDCPKLFMDAPEWTKITVMAKEILQAFDYQKLKT